MAVVSVVGRTRVRSEVVDSAVFPPFPFPFPLLPLPFPITLLTTEPIPESCRFSAGRPVRRSKRVDILVESRKSQISIFVWIRLCTGWLACKAASDEREERINDIARFWQQHLLSQRGCVVYTAGERDWTRGDRVSFESDRARLRVITSFLTVLAAKVDPVGREGDLAAVRGRGRDRIRDGLDVFEDGAFPSLVLELCLAGALGGLGLEALVVAEYAGEHGLETRLSDRDRDGNRKEREAHDALLRLDVVHPVDRPARGEDGEGKERFRCPGHSMRAKQRVSAEMQSCALGPTPFDSPLRRAAPTAWNDTRWRARLCWTRTLPAGDSRNALAIK